MLKQERRAVRAFKTSKQKSLRELRHSKFSGIEGSGSHSRKELITANVKTHELIPQSRKGINI